MTPKLWIIAALLVLSTLTLLLYAIDKWLAKHDKRRISERRLLIASFFGPMGAVLGVLLVRHKSKKLSYQLRLVPILILSAAAWGWFVYRI